MWCTACGAPLPTPARHCSRCGRRPDPRPLCEAGRALGGLRIRDTETTEVVAGTTLSGMDTTGTQRLYEVDGPKDLHLWLAVIQWRGGEREVRRTRRYETPWWQDHLLGRQRLAIEAWGDGYCRSS